MDLNNFLAALENTNASTVPSIIRALQTAKTTPTTKAAFIKLLDVTQTPAIGIMAKLKKAKLISYSINEQGEQTVNVHWVPDNTGTIKWVNDRGMEFSEAVVRQHVAMLNLCAREDEAFKNTYMLFAQNNPGREHEFWVQ
jgi:hypothetical protein